METQNTLTCPVCNGSCKVELTEQEKKYSWNVGKTHKECVNCGGQTMYGKATGLTYPRRDNGEPCVHDYDVYNRGRCYHQYVCKHCGFSHYIDSGD